MASPVEAALRRAVADLDALKVRWALIGGLAVSVRSVPRFTKDLDFAIAAANDSEPKTWCTGCAGAATSLSRFLSRSMWSASPASGWSVAALT